MIGAYGSLVVQVDVYPRCAFVEGSGAESKYIVALEFILEIINFAIVLVVVVILVLVVVIILFLRLCIAAAPPP